MIISDKFKHTKYIKLADFLSKDNFKKINLFDKNREKRDDNEVFTCFELRGTPHNNRTYGYTRRNVVINNMFSKVFQDNYRNQNIHFIEWDDRFLVCFNDGICISTHHCFVTKEEVFQFIRELDEEGQNVRE